MAVVIRLARHGRHLAPYYRIVVADKEMKRDGRHLEIVGTYLPKASPSVFTLKEERIKYWIGVGAKPSDTVSQLIEKKLPGFLGELEERRRKKIQAARKKRRDRNAKGGAKAAPAKKAVKAPKAKKSAAK